MTTSTFSSVLNVLDVHDVHGYSAEDMDIHAERLQIQLPEGLTAFYQTYAATPEFQATYNRILAPDAWYLLDQRLIFAEEHQMVVLWGIEVSKHATSDPRVQIMNNTTPPEWFDEDLTVSGFLPFLALYNLVIGTFEYLTEFTLSAERVAALRRDAIYDEIDNQMRIVVKAGYVYTVGQDGEGAYACLRNSKHQPATAC